MNLRTLTASLAALVLAASCTSGTEGIFASIEREQKIVDAGNLNNASTVTHMAEFSGSYYAAGGRALFSRTTGGTKWSATVSLATAAGTVSPRNYVAVGVGGGSKLFALANSGASASNRLYSSTDGATWVDVTPAGFIPAAMVPVRQTDGVGTAELVVTSSDYASVVLISGGAPGAVVSLGLGAGGTPITAAAKTGTDYYLVNDNYVSYLNNFAYAADPRVTGISSTYGHGYRGLIILVGQSVANGAYLSTINGYILHGALSGTTWTPDATVPVVANHSTTGTNNATVAYDQFLYDSHTPSLWVGSETNNSAEGFGYAAISTTLGVSYAPPAGTGSSNYTSSKIGTFRVPLLFGASNGTKYLGTWAHGLWTWDSSAQKWSQE